MPAIKFSADLRNDYNGISYEKLTARFELYTSLERGFQDIQEGNTF